MPMKSSPATYHVAEHVLGGVDVRFEAGRSSRDLDGAESTEEVGRMSASGFAAASLHQVFQSNHRQHELVGLRFRIPLPGHLLNN